MTTIKHRRAAMLDAINSRFSGRAFLSPSELLRYRADKPKKAKLRLPKPVANLPKRTPKPAKPVTKKEPSRRAVQDLHAGIYADVSAQSGKGMTAPRLRTGDYVGFRAPRKLKAKLIKAAREANRSLSTETQFRLEQSFDREAIIRQTLDYWRTLHQ